MPETAARTIVTFKSTAFNTTEQKESFVNPDCFGEDVGAWLIGELRGRGLATDSAPDSEDFGWYFGFTVEGCAYRFVIGYRPEEEGEGGDWIAWVERAKAGLLGLFGPGKQAVAPQAVSAIHTILSTSPQVREVRWHRREDFDRGREELGTPTP